MKTITIKLYSFSELSKEAQQKVLENLSHINVDHGWWESTYEDAKNIGLKITGFDLDRARHAKGEFLLSADEVAQNILKSHGDACETYKTAQKFIDECKIVISSTPVVFEEGTDDEFEDYSDRNFQIEELEQAFLESLLEDYFIILQNECEYLQSKEAIIETIEANEYTFEENGKMRNG